MNSWAERVEFVTARAGNRCEYCRMHQCLQGATFHVEHIQPRAHGGTSEPENLALACPTCNLRKSDRRSVDDVVSGSTVCLFHPRHHIWSEHFAWDGYYLIGLTEIGLGTILALNLNHDRRILIRQAEEQFELF